MLPGVMRKELRFRAIYIPLALFCFAVNSLAFYQEMESKRIARVKIESIKKDQERQNLTTACQNLTAILIRNINILIDKENDQQLQNAGILEDDPKNFKVKGREKFRNARINRLESQKTALSTFFSTDIETIYQQISYISSQLSEKEKRGITIPAYKESAAKSFLAIPAELIAFIIMIVISLFVEAFILVFAGLALRAPDGGDQKLSKSVKVLSKFDEGLSKKSDAQSKFSELIKNPKCRAWLDEKNDGLSPSIKDKRGWRSTSNVPTGDRKLFIEFRDFCNRNPEIIKEYKEIP
jgi:hypothetical protein